MLKFKTTQNMTDEKPTFAIISIYSLQSRYHTGGGSVQPKVYYTFNTSWYNMVQP